jgi:hypothetical protein
MENRGKAVYRGVTIKTTDPVNDLDDLAHIMINLRHHTELWNRHYGSMHRANKVNWEKRADKWLADHGMEVKPGSIEREEIKTENNETANY